MCTWHSWLLKWKMKWIAHTISWTSTQEQMIAANSTEDFVEIKCVIFVLVQFHYAIIIVILIQPRKGKLFFLGYFHSDHDFVPRFILLDLNTFEQCFSLLMKIFTKRNAFSLPLKTNGHLFANTCFILSYYQMILGRIITRVYKIRMNWKSSDFWWSPACCSHFQHF